eukprot:scaffold1828_cov169-Amphora_coffeaeformis.AAC.26
MHSLVDSNNDASRAGANSYFLTSLHPDPATIGRQKDATLEHNTTLPLTLANTPFKSLTTCTRQ